MAGTSNGIKSAPGAGTLQLSGGSAIVAPVSAFPNGVPSNALIVLPLTKPTEELTAMLDKGPHAVQVDEMWKLLGFNGPAVQVQDDQGRPIAIGLEDLLAGLEKHWTEQPDDLNRARIYAQELMKYQRHDKAEQALSKVVARGGTGDDWLALGVSQLLQDKLDKAEGTLKGAVNLLTDNPYPPLHLAKLYQKKGDAAAEREWVEKSIATQVGCVDAWAYLFNHVREKQNEEAAVAEVERLAADKKSAAPYIAMQGFFANAEETRDKAVAFAKKGLEKDPDDPLALLCLSALFGQKGDLEAVIRLLTPHEAKMSRDIRLANNYFEALFQARQIDKVNKLLNALASSPNREVKQFAIERAKFVSQFLQKQQAQLQQAMKKSESPLVS